MATLTPKDMSRAAAHLAAVRNPTKKKQRLLSELRGLRRKALAQSFTRLLVKPMGARCATPECCATQTPVCVSWKENQRRARNRRKAGKKLVSQLTDVTIDEVTALGVKDIAD